MHDDEKKSRQYYFSEANKGERERWVCTEFLRTLGLSFSDKEVISVVQRDDHRDVVFRDANFQVKEIPDPGRRRDDEYKENLANAELGVLRARVCKVETATPAQVGEIIYSKAELASQKYERVRAALDLLFYENRRCVHLSPNEGPMPSVEEFAQLGFRSISALKGDFALVFWASSAAPSFLREKIGTITSRL